MFIFNLTLSNYRSYEQASIEMQPGLNIFVGDNAHGKSNLLEAIYLLSTLRSSRASTDADLVRREVLETEFPVARVTAEVRRAAGNLGIEIAIVGKSNGATQRAGKRVRVNGQPRKASDAVGQLTAVLFTTHDIEVAAGPPLLRRRYLDMMISQVDRSYLRAMQKYASVLQQRNGLLKRIQAREASTNELGYWDQELSHAGGIIMHGRSQALGVLLPYACEQMEKLSDDKEELQLTYRPALAKVDELHVPIDEAEWIARMTLALKKARDQETRRGMTVVGPHRDDVSVEINGMPADGFASRAQLRTAALALRLAEAHYLKEALGDEPVVLLDDVLSELDARRRQGVMEYFQAFEQVIVTTADADRLRDVLTKATGRFVVGDGTLMPFEGE